MPCGGHRRGVRALCICTCAHVHEYMYKCMHMHMYMCACTCTCTCIDVYVVKPQVVSHARIRTLRSPLGGPRASRPRANNRVRTVPASKQNSQGRRRGQCASMLHQCRARPPPRRGAPHPLQIVRPLAAHAAPTTSTPQPGKAEAPSARAAAGGLGCWIGGARISTTFGETCRGTTCL